LAVGGIVPGHRPRIFPGSRDLHRLDGNEQQCPVSHGPRIGTLAEYIAIGQDDVVPKPASLTLHEAAAAPLVSLAAWQALVDRAHVRPGQKVPVHAGSGGLGSTVIQRWPA
jgi:NADPH:quinone reductase-like Zn-dependent oxidoreductase